MRRSLFGRLGLGAVLVCAIPALTQVGLASVEGLSVQQSIQAFRQANPHSGLMEREGRIVQVYGRSFGLGANALQSAESFMTEHTGMFGVEPGELMLGGPGSPNGDGALPIGYLPETNSYKFTGVYYAQHHEGIPVFRSRLVLLVRNDASSPLVLANADLRDLGSFSTDGLRVRPVAAAYRSGVEFSPALETFSAGEMVIWAGVDDLLEQPRLAVQYVAQGGDETDPASFEKWLFVVDAEDGRILYFEDQILEVDVAGNVSGMATQGVGADICEPEAQEVMPYAEVTIVGGNTAFADVNGDYVIPHGGSGAVTVQSPVEGLYFDVDNEAGANTVLSQVVTPPGPANFVHNAANTSEHQRAEVNAYVEANVVRDWILAANPTYPTISTQTHFDTNVNINSSCNATYNGNSINFYRAAGGCSNTANTVIVHHEYGHHLVATGGSGQGQYGEGTGDCMGVIITDTSELAIGFNNNCNTGIRDADNTIQYPCSGPIHDCGQLISGCVWDTRHELVVTEPDDYQEILMFLMVNSVLVHNGSNIGPDITVAWMTLDDDDGDIGNGTPHYDEIQAGFSLHNMPGPELDFIQFEFPNGVPDVIDPNGGTTVRVEVVGLIADPQPGTGIMHLDTGGGFVEFPMDEVEDNIYDAIFPAVDCGSQVAYFFSAETTDGDVYTAPRQGAAAPFTAVSATGFNVTLDDDFESDMGWTVGAPGDNATTGVWERVDPNGTEAQPGDDHSPEGTLCFVTGQCAPGCGLGDSDVDDGTTTLLSPIFDLSESGGALISYWRWYSNDTGADPNNDVFVIDISNDGGNSWTNVEVVGPAGPEASGGWFLHQFTASTVIEPTSQMQMRFLASDLSSGSLVEAAIDDFLVTEILCDEEIPEDLDGDGDVDSGDLAILLGSWGPCEGCPADLNGDGVVDAADLALLLGAWTG